MRWPWTRQVESVKSSLDAINRRLDALSGQIENRASSNDAAEIADTVDKLNHKSDQSFRDFKVEIGNASAAMAGIIAKHAEETSKTIKTLADAVIDVPEKFPVLPSADELANVFRGSQDDLLNEVSTLRIKVAELEGAVKIAEQRVAESDKASRALANWIHTTHRLDMKGVPGTIKQMFQSPTKP